MGDTHSSETKAHIMECRCECGKSKYAVTSKPVLRFRCHCSICQEVYQKPYADFLVFKARDVDLPKLNGIQFKRYKAPPAVDRGKCPSCRKPVISFFKMAMVPGLHLAMVPTSVYPSTEHLPEPKADIFYDRRVTDMADDVPKYKGYLSSEWQVFKHVLKTLP